MHRSSANTVHMARFVRWLLKDAPDGVFFELTAIAPPHLDLKPREVRRRW